MNQKITALYVDYTINLEFMYKLLNIVGIIINSESWFNTLQIKNNIQHLDWRVYKTLPKNDPTTMKIYR